MDSHCKQKAANDNAKKIVQACEDKFEANKDDCNKFLKAVAAALGVTGKFPIVTPTLLLKP